MSVRGFTGMGRHGYHQETSGHEENTSGGAGERERVVEVPRHVHSV